MKIFENPKVFWCFQGAEKGCIGNEWVKWENISQPFTRISFIKVTSLITYYKRFVLIIYYKNGNQRWIWRQWPSGLRRFSKNLKVPGPTSGLARLMDSTSLWDSQWPLGRKCKTQWLTSGESGCPSHSWPWGSQIAVKKNSKKLILKIVLNYIILII